MRIILFCCLAVLLLIPILFCIGCGNGAKYPVFGPTIDMIHGTWELDRTYLDGVYNEVSNNWSYTYIFNEDNTGESIRRGISPSHSEFIWTATNDSITVYYQNYSLSVGFHYYVDWTELWLRSGPYLETTPEDPYGTGRTFYPTNIFVRQD